MKFEWKHWSDVSDCFPGFTSHSVFIYSSLFSIDRPVDPLVRTKLPPFVPLLVFAPRCTSFPPNSTISGEKKKRKKNAQTAAVNTQVSPTSPKLIPCYGKCCRMVPPLPAHWLLSLLTPEATPPPLTPPTLGWCSLFVTLQSRCFPTFTAHFLPPCCGAVNYVDTRRLQPGNGLFFSFILWTPGAQLMCLTPFLPQKSPAPTKRPNIILFVHLVVAGRAGALCAGLKWHCARN